jgi:mRNA-degrading endonuclease RelE of RelBE toxin-antitoxin system
MQGAKRTQDLKQRCPALAYSIIYSPEAKVHLRAFTAQQRALILDTVDRQLQQQPPAETKNRKRMNPNPIAGWELRIRQFRVYYEVDEPAAAVSIIGIGVKIRNRVWLGGEEVDFHEDPGYHGSQ